MRERIRSVLICLLLVTYTFVMFDIAVDFIEEVQGITLYVNETGVGAYDKIQNAINDSNPGDTIFVYSGTYYENVIVNKRVNLTGQDRDTTVIDGGGSGDVVRITVDEVNVSGFKINGGGGFFWDAGIELDDVDNCRILNNNISLNSNFGLYLSSSNNNNITDNILTSNNEGICFSSLCYWNNISGNTISSNSQYGISLSSSSWNTITDNTISPSNNCGIYISSSNENNITNNNVSYNSGYGIYLSSSSDNDIIDNQVSFGSMYGLRLSSSDDNRIIGNNASNNDFGIRLFTSNENEIIGNTVLSNIESGIEIGTPSTYNMISNNEISNSDYGIDLGYSNFSIVSDNIISSCRIYGIFLTSCEGINVTGNEMIENGICINGNSLNYWNTHYIDTSNNVGGKPVYYWKNLTGGIIPPGAGQVILANCSNIEINNQELNYGSVGILVGFSLNTSIMDNIISFNTWYGIVIAGSNETNIINNTISQSNYAGITVYGNFNDVIDNTISYCGFGMIISSCSHCNVTYNVIYLNGEDGIRISYSSNNTIDRNSISSSVNNGIRLSSSHYNNLTSNNIYLNDDSGIYLYDSCMNNIIYNKIHSNHFDGIYINDYSDDNQFGYNNITNNDWMGLRLSGCERNKIIGNTISKNKVTGFHIYDDAINNSIYHNNIIDNDEQADDNTMGENHWDNGYPSGGNYWSDYTGVDQYSGPGQNISGSDGKGDTPYIITFISKDHYPLMKPVTTPGPRIQLLSPQNNSVNKPGVILDFYIYDEDIDTVEYIVNGESSNPFFAPYNIFTIGWPDDTYIIKINATDFEGNFNSSWFLFILDSILPMIYLNSPQNNSVFTEGIILDFFVIDSNLLEVNFSIDGGINVTLSNPYDISTSGWTDGGHTVQINALDIAGNFNSSLFYFTIDNTKPYIQLNSPVNNSVIPAGMILDFNIIDSNLLHVNYSVNGEVEIPFFEPFDIYTAGWWDRNYTIYINAVDLAGNSNSSWYSFSIESNPPIIILNSPENNSIIPSGKILDFSILDPKLSHANYSINGGMNVTLTEPYDISTSGWPDGDNIIQINAMDMMGNSNSSWFMFTVDSISPAIELLSPINNSLICGSTILDFSIVDLHLYKVNYTLDSGPTIPLFSPFNISTSVWQEGDHTVQINAVDLAGNSNSSWYFFTMESCPPTVILNFPLNNSVIQSGTILDFSIMDPNLFQVNYSVNGAPETPFYDPFNISTVTWPEGDYFIQINALDTVGNFNYTWFIFSIDNTEPNIQLNHPENNSIIPDNTIIDYLIIDLHLMEVNYSVNGGSIFLLSDPFDISTLGWDEEDCTIQINAIDMAGNQNSSWYFFTIDSTKPIIQLNNPQNNSVISDGTIIDLLVFDLNLMWVNYSVNGGPKVSLSDPYEISTTSWEEKGYTILVNAIDVAGNSNSSWYFFTVDSTPLSISLNTPKNNSVIPSGTILDFYTMDSDLSHANYSINGDSEIPFSEPFDIQTSSFDDGDYSIQINLIDTAGNTNSFWYYFIIDSTSPSIILNDPENTSVINSGIILEFSIIDTNLLEVYYSINNMGNISFSSPYDLSTSDWPDGNYTIQIIAYDFAGNFNLTSYYFTIDSVKPIIVLVNPEDQSIIRVGVELYFAITDQNLLYVNYSLNGEGNIPLSEPFEISTEDWKDGECKVRINAKDSGGNTNSSLFSFTIDSTSPSIILNTPLNNSIIRVGTILDFNIYDMNLLWANYSIDGGFDIHLVEPFDISPSGLTEDEHTVQINAIDLAGNYNSRWFVFTIDSTAPNISFNTELNHSTLIAGETIQIDISAPDLDTVFYSIDGGDYDTLEPPYIITTDTWTEGSHTLEIVARDQVGNEITQWLEVKIDAISPYIVSTYPQKNARDVERDTVLIITFSELMHQNHVEDYLTLSPYLEFSYHWDEEGKILTISFGSNELAEGTTYRLKIQKQIADINGNTMGSDFELAFTTKGVDTGADGGETDGVETEPLVFVLAGLIIVALIIVFIILWLLFFKDKRPGIKEKVSPKKKDVNFEDITKESQPPPEKESAFEEIIEDTEEDAKETEFEFMPPPPPPIPPPPPPP